MDIHKCYDFPKKIQNLKIFKTRFQSLFWQFFEKNETKKLFLNFETNFIGKRGKFCVRKWGHFYFYKNLKPKYRVLKLFEDWDEVAKFKTGKFPGGYVENLSKIFLLA